MTRRRIAYVLFLTSSLALGACGGNSANTATQDNSLPVAAANTQQQEVSFDLNLSALLVKEVIPGTFLDQSSAANLMNGTMKVTRIATDEIEFYPWTVNIDENDLNNVQSFQTLVLEPDNYLFELTVSEGNYTYSGSSVNNLSDGDTALMPLTIRPVIGDTVTDTNITQELIDFRFSYSAVDINTANLSNPSMGISIDGNAEQIFELNPSTGLSEHMLLNLQPGQYDMALRLLDNGIQIGKSVEAQETGVLVSQGLDVSMDIIPLHAEVAFNLTTEGEDATLNFQIPSEVVEEAGSIADLQTILRVTGSDYPLHEQALALNATAGGYTATAVLPNIYYSDLTIEMTFTDTSDDEEIGYCVTSTVLTNAGSAVNCDLTLRRRQIVAGSLLSAVGVNVRAENGLSTPGAVISIGEQETAITNSAAFSTPGYSKIYVAAGTHTIRAQLGTAFGEVEFTSIPLSVNNIDIILNRYDTDGDGVEDSLDLCPNEAANTQNGCDSNISSDLVLTGTGKVSVRLNDGLGGFIEVQQTQAANVHHYLDVGDLNQDGLDDVAALRSDGSVLVALAPFTNGLSLVQVGTKTGSHPRDIEVADFNNDDVLDFVVGGQNYHSIFLGNGDGSFGSEITFSALTIDNRSLAVGDFDLDGNVDVTVNSNTGNCLLAIHYGDGTGNFPASATASFPGLLGLYVKTGDVDADGDLDILTAGYGYGVRVFTNNGNRNFTVEAAQFTDETFVFPEDYNGDGAVDLVIVNDVEQQLKVRLNDGLGGFANVTNLGSVSNWARAGVTADINSDGKKDIVVTQHNGSTLTTILGNGDGTFQPSVTATSGMQGLLDITAGNFD